MSKHRAGQSKAGREHECHPHVAGPPFGIGQQPNGQPVVIGMQRVCCHCGRLSVAYQGVVDENVAACGPHIEYERVGPAPRIVLAGGLLPKPGHG